MSLIFLLTIALQNIVIPGVYLSTMLTVAVRNYKKSIEIASRELRSVEKNLRPPPDFENKYSKEFIEYMIEYAKNTMKSQSEFHDSLVRDSYSYFIFELQLGQSFQILISIGIAFWFYLHVNQYITIVLLLQSVISAVFGILFSVVKYIYYPREVPHLN